MNNETFDLKRFENYLKCYLGENRRSLLITAIVMLAVPTFLVTIFTWMSIDIYAHTNRLVAEGYSSGNNDPGQWIVGLTLMGCGMLFAAVAGSKAFSSLSTKHGRVNFFMTPASNLEKFLTLMLIYFAGFFLLYYCSAFLANWLRVLFFSVDPTVAKYIKALPLREMVLYPDDYEHPLRAMAMLWGLILVIPSFFTLGGCLWPKHGFLMSVATVIVLQIVVTSLASVPFVSMAINDTHISPRFDWLEDESHIFILIAAFEFVLTVGCIVLSYFRMKEWEVISRW